MLLKLVKFPDTFGKFSSANVVSCVMLLKLAKLPDTFGMHQSKTMVSCVMLLRLAKVPGTDIFHNYIFFKCVRVERAARLPLTFVRSACGQKLLLLLQLSSDGRTRSATTLPVSLEQLIIQSPEFC